LKGIFNFVYLSYWVTVRIYLFNYIITISLFYIILNVIIMLYKIDSVMFFYFAYIPIIFLTFLYIYRNYDDFILFFVFKCIFDSFSHKNRNILYVILYSTIRGNDKESNLIQKNIITFSNFWNEFHVYNM